MSEWTPERIEAVEAFAAELRPMQGAGTDLLALAEIGLAVVKADPETVERVARAIYALAPPLVWIPTSGTSGYSGAPYAFNADEAGAYRSAAMRHARTALREMGETTLPGGDWR